MKMVQRKIDFAGLNALKTKNNFLEKGWADPSPQATAACQVRIKDEPKINTLYKVFYWPYKISM